ncbi:hypothetical protein [Algoriphagus resistens]|uniref:hypothetical protein n=1 Tax=Algoriphagus resistens TaxID=1750590 RepID=UPI000716BA19|nr:hypothetical protein [Algoriphagus resistens]
MSRYHLVFLTLFIVNFACKGPQSEESLLLGSLDKLPSVEIKDISEFSFGNEHILISGPQQAISLKTIQLVSGFTVAIKTEKELICLDSPDRIIKYPFANKQYFPLEKTGLDVNQLQILSQDKLGITMLFYIKNVGNSVKNMQFQVQVSTDLKPNLLMDSLSESNAADQVIFDEMTDLFTAKDRKYDWYAVWGSTADIRLNPINSACFSHISELGASAGFEISLTLAPQQEQMIPLFIAGSDQNEFAAMEVLADLRSDLFSDWNENFALLDSLQSTSKLSVPSPEIQEAYEWSKYKTGLFQFSIDSKPDTTRTDFREDLFEGVQFISKDFAQHVDQAIFSTKTPRHVSPGYQLIQPLLLHLLGIRGDIENRVTFIRPNLPEEWKEASLENLWIDDNKLKVSITSEENQMTVEVTQTQKKAGISIELPQEFSKMKVLGKEINSDTKDGFRRILMTGDHVRIEAKKDKNATYFLQKL